MRLVVRVFTRRNLIAIAIGVLLAAAPLVAFDFWLDGLIDRQGQAEVATAARRATRASILYDAVLSPRSAIAQTSGRGPPATSFVESGHLHPVWRADIPVRCGRTFLSGR